MNTDIKMWYNGGKKELMSFIQTVEQYFVSNNIHDDVLAYKKVYQKLGSQVQHEFDKIVLKK